MYNILHMAINQFCVYLIGKVNSERTFYCLLYVSGFLKMMPEDKALFYLDLAGNYPSYVDDYTIFASFLLGESHSRWCNLCAMCHLFKHGNR